MNYNYHQFDPFSRFIFYSETQIECNRRQTDEDQPGLPADMERNMCEYDYILGNVIAPLNYNNDQFDSFSLPNSNCEFRMKCYRRQIDEDQHW